MHKYRHLIVRRTKKDLHRQLLWTVTRFEFGALHQAYWILSLFCIQLLPCFVRKKKPNSLRGIILSYKVRLHLQCATTENESVCLHLFLSQDEDPSRFDRVPGGKIYPGPLLHSVLVGLPLSIPCCPSHTHVVPLPVTQRQGERHRLRDGIVKMVRHWFKHILG